MLKKILNFTVCLTFLLQTTVPMSALAENDSSTIGGGGPDGPEFQRSLREKRIVGLNLQKLDEAKNLAAKLENQQILFAIMDILREWRKVESHYQKRNQVEKLIQTALANAVEGRFQLAEFVITDTTQRLVNDDQEVFQNGLLAQYQEARRDLSAFMARETIRSKRQTMDVYNIEYTKRIETNRIEEDGILFWSSQRQVTDVTKVTENLNVRVPELVTGNPIYDQDNQRIYSRPHVDLVEDDFKHKVNGILQPYSRTQSSNFSFNDHLVPGVVNGIVQFLHAIDHPYCHARHAVLPKSWELFSYDYFKHNSRYQDGPLRIRYRGTETYPLLQADIQVWNNALDSKFSRVRGLLNQMWAHAENGYKFTVSSSNYDRFIGFYQQLANSLREVEGKWLSRERILELGRPFATLIGSRPDSLETAIEMAVLLAPENIRELLAQAISFDVKPKSIDSMLLPEYQALQNAPAPDVINGLRSRNTTSADIVQDLVALYMQGKEVVVRDIFMKISEHIKRKIDLVTNKLNLSKEEIFRAKTDPTLVDIQGQLNFLNQAVAVVNNAQTNAFVPDLVLTEKEFKTALSEGKSKEVYKRIYKNKDAVEHVQRELRLAFGQAKNLINQARSLYLVTPTKEIRERLLECIRFYHARMAELNSEYWPYKKFGAPVIAKNPDGTDMFEFLDSGEARPIYTQPWSVDELVLFSTEQTQTYALNNVITVDEVELSYLRSYFNELYVVMERSALTIGEVYREFTEYPSHRVSVLLKQSLEDFQKLRREINTDIDTARLCTQASCLNEVAKLKAEFIERVNKINWVNEAQTQGHSEASMMVAIESLRTRYNDLLIIGR